MEEQHANKYIKTDDATRKKLCEAIDRGSILNEAALTLGIPNCSADLQTLSGFWRFCCKATWRRQTKPPDSRSSWVYPGDYRWWRNNNSIGYSGTIACGYRFDCWNKTIHNAIAGFNYSFKRLTINSFTKLFYRGILSFNVFSCMLLLLKNTVHKYFSRIWWENHRD